MIATLDGSVVAQLTHHKSTNTYELIILDGDEMRTINHKEIQYLKEEVGFKFGGGRFIQWQSN